MPRLAKYAIKDDGSTKTQSELFDECIEVIRSGKSLRQACLGRMTDNTFYEIVDSCEERKLQYARAMAKRAESIFEDILDIADDGSNDKMIVDGVEMTNHENIQRSRLRVDSRKWFLSKIMPKLYGDKLDLTSDGEKLNQTPPIQISIDGKNITLE